MNTSVSSHPATGIPGEKTTKSSLFQSQDHGSQSQQSFGVSASQNHIRLSAAMQGLSRRQSLPRPVASDFFSPDNSPSSDSSSHAYTQAQKEVVTTSQATSPNSAVPGAPLFRCEPCNSIFPNEGALDSHNGAFHRLKSLKRRKLDTDSTHLTLNEDPGYQCPCGGFYENLYKFLVHTTHCPDIPGNPRISHSDTGEKPPPPFAQYTLVHLIQKSFGIL